MVRDLELMRTILLTIEEKFQAGQGIFHQLNLDGYDMRTIAEHCDLLYQAGLIKDFKATRDGNGRIITFSVGNLTNTGFDYLELIRNDEIWNKTEKEIEEKNLPKTIEFIAKVAGIFVGNVEMGKFCNISHQVTIGIGGRQDSELEGVPTIGNYVYIAPGAKIFGKIRIGNNVSIGANAVVSKDIPDNATVVGNPGRIVGYQEKNKNIHNVY